MQHQRAIVMTDETIIDQRERVQLEVNSAMAGKSRLLSGEPSAALTKSCSRSCRAPEAGPYTPWTILRCRIALGPWLLLSGGCLVPARRSWQRAPLRGARCVEGALPPGCARCLAPEHRSVGSQDWLGTAAVGTQPGCSASLARLMCR